MKVATVHKRDAMYICMPLASYANRAHLQNMEHIPSKSYLNQPQLMSRASEQASRTCPN